MKKFQNLIIKPEKTIIEALKLMDSIETKLLIVLENEKFIGLISIGDIQRAIIKDVNLNSSVQSILRENFKIANENHSFDEIKQMMIDYRMEFCPVINKNEELINVIFWSEITNDQKIKPQKSFDLPIIVMAGGFGTRLRPLTNVLPKPLIPISDKSMLEDIFEKFANHGSKKFYISVNYKSELIEYYIKNQKLDYSIEFFKEDKPYGTAGSLTLIKDKIKSTFFVSNCDILVEEDYSSILDYHYQQKNEITIVAALKNYSIPYGIIETGEGGKLVNIEEKPDLTFKINSGMYILEPHLLNEIPENEFFHITHLIEKIKARSGNIGVFPVSEKSWKDVGNWDDYLTFL